MFNVVKIVMIIAIKIIKLLKAIKIINFKNIEDFIVTRFGLGFKLDVIPIDEEDIMILLAN